MKDEKCLFCNVHSHPDQEKKIIAENEKHVALVNVAPRSKAHSLIITRDHRKGIDEVIQEEWNTMLPLIKDVLERINKVYKPIGFNLYITSGDESKEHFHLHIIPKYKKGYGLTWSKEKNELLPGEHREKAYQESVKRLSANSEGVIRENDKAIARLFPKDEARSQSHIIIKPKKSLPNDVHLSQVDQEIWNQMGELILATIHQMKEKFNWGKELLALRVRIPLGKMTGIEETSFSEFQAHIITRFSDVWILTTKADNEGRRIKKPRKEAKDKIIENERYAEKLRNPDKYVKERAKKYQIMVKELTNHSTKEREREREREIWKQPYLYLAFVSGAGIVLLGLGVYWLISRKTKK